MKTPSLKELFDSPKVGTKAVINPAWEEVSDFRRTYPFESGWNKTVNISPPPERLQQALSVSQSPSHWNRWVMDMGTGRMIEVSK